MGYGIRGLIVAAVLAAAGALFAVPAYAQVGYDRVGGDYLTFNIRSGDPTACARRCERDSRCRAWSFSFPRTKRTPATCSLKKSVPPRVANPCCVSSVRGAGVIAPRAGGSTEMSISRHGGNYRHFALPSDPTGRACLEACKKEKRCRAFTYVRPGYGGRASARCYLKKTIPRPKRGYCCISGVVR
ncbi:MAG: PAN domain-containing protein [Pseudolabrys sp.]